MRPGHPAPGGGQMHATPPPMLSSPGLAPFDTNPAPAYLAVRRAVLPGFGALAVLVLGFGFWAWLIPIAGAVIAPGQVEVVQSRQVIQHPHGGVVADILVVEGERVAAGSLLLRLEDAALAAELALVESALHDLRARRARLEAERDNDTTIALPTGFASGHPDDLAAVIVRLPQQHRLFQARRETAAQLLTQLDHRSDQLRAQLRGLDAQGRAVAAQRDIVARELTTQEALHDGGLVPANRLLALRREAARLDGAAAEIDSQRTATRALEAQVAIESARIGAERREAAETALEELAPREAELVQRRRALRQRTDRLEIRAPVGGVVHGLQITTPRGVLRAAEPAMEIVPQDRPLVVAARIEPTDIDRIFAGQKARLAFPALDRRTTPELSGTVTLVSADTFFDRSLGASFYRAEIAIDPAEASRLGDGVLRPGMPVEVFVTTRPRSLFAYLLRPLSDYFAHALRED